MAAPESCPEMNVKVALFLELFVDETSLCATARASKLQAVLLRAPALIDLERQKK